MSYFFFFNGPATPEIYTLSLHDALPISRGEDGAVAFVDPDGRLVEAPPPPLVRGDEADRKSTRLNSSHGYISYAVFCLKKKKIQLNRGTLSLTEINPESIISSTMDRLPF